MVDKIWAKSVPLGHVAEVWNGLSIQSLPIFANEPDSEHHRPCLRGRDVQRYHVRPDVQFIRVTDAAERRRLPLEAFCRPKIVVQDIVAHIKTPLPHIKLTATIDASRNWLNVNTVTNITSSEYCLEYLCGLLNSRLMSWYAYDFIYNRAIRTIHFRRGYADQIPIRRIDQSDPADKLMHDKLVGQVNQMLSLHREETPAEARIAELDAEIDGLIPRLYGITDEDVRFLRKHAGFYGAVQ